MKKESIMGSVELQKVAEKMNLKNLTPQIGLLMCRILTARRYSSQAFLNILNPIEYKW